MMTMTRSRLRQSSGFSLLESMFAIGVLTVVALGLLPLGMMATNTTENQGHLVARATEYAQDKMEQLLALSYGDVTTDTRVLPATETGGSGLAFGGSDNPAAPVATYVDYLDINGTLLSSASGVPPAWFYKRVWSVTAVPGVPNLPSGVASMKEVSVTAIVKSASGSVGRIPQANVKATKTFPF